MFDTVVNALINV